MPQKSTSTPLAGKARLTKPFVVGREQKAAYRKMREHVNGYIKFEGTIEELVDGKLEKVQKVLFLRCTVVDGIGKGAPSEDGHEVVRFIEELVKEGEATSLPEVAHAFFQKLFTYHKQSQAYFQLYTTMFEMHDNFLIFNTSGIQSLRFVHGDYRVKDDFLYQQTPPFQPMYYQEQWFAELDRAEWIYTINVTTLWFDVQKRQNDKSYDLLWAHPLKSLTTDWIDSLETGRKDHKAHRVIRRGIGYEAAVANFFQAVDCVTGPLQEALDDIKGGDHRANAVLRALAEWKVFRDL